ncbi:hypothetical protein FYK55_27735 [Roseiconus nitratireducens]|uniref:Leucine Rich repeats (2 copies) n=1 Tax=Roseiconus nitratireducens TaxID=2605748 RepID=A0A5M6CVK8_9BACT|nr:hypothetical protein [Roseiconus nitratireducens]KAA5538012.1 hypothetical protein FYK55_27735 [Roseiconus nitratireducens]
MDSALIDLTDRGARFTFLGEPFRSRQRIPNEDIVEIDFSQIEITDADVEALLPLTNLEGISFWNTGISDHAMERISQLRQLTRLNLCGTQVTDASVSILVGMALDYIDVANTKLTTGGVEALREGLPHAEILA